jgi:peptidyl-prolyl cis-trans isomerase SurA
MLRYLFTRKCSKQGYSPLPQKTGEGVFMRAFFRPALIVAALGTTLGVSHPSAEIIEQVLVKVNGDIITKTDFERRQVQVLRARGIQSTDDAALKKAIDEITPDLIVDTIDELLMTQRGRELGQKLTDEEFDKVVANIRKENKLESDEAFHAALKQEGMTLADLRKSLERQMLISRVTQREVMDKVSITEEEARKYHAEHAQQFTTPGTITIREILVKVPVTNQGVNVAADETAKQKAEDARRRVIGGESFEQVAAEVSDSPSKANGGLVGPLNVQELNPAFLKLIDPLKVGDVTEVVRSQNGYQLVKLEARSKQELLPAEKVRDKIADALYEQKRGVETQKYLAKLRAQAIIQWRNEELKKIWEAKVATLTPPPSDPPPATPAEKPAEKPASSDKPTNPSR